MTVFVRYSKSIRTQSQGKFLKRTAYASYSNVLGLQIIKKKKKKPVENYNGTVFVFNDRNYVIYKQDIECLDLRTLFENKVLNI